MTNTTYTIQMASKLSGVGVHTIRAWEKRYKALEPIRDASGHRTYTKLDVEKLMLLSELCLLGYTISKVAGMCIFDLKELLIDLGKTEESLQHTEFNLVNDTKLTIDAEQSLPILNFALKSYKPDVISQELGKLKQLLSSKDFALKILLPLTRSLQDFESSGIYTTHQSEALKSLLKFHMNYNLYHPVNNQGNKGSTHIIVSGMKGDLNDLGLGVIGLLCHHYGFHYTYLGSDMSHEALEDMVRALAGNVVIIGPGNVHAQVGKAYFQNYIEKIAMRLDPTTDLVVAGKNELEIDKVSSKHLLLLKTIDAVDAYLENKNH